MPTYTRIIAQQQAIYLSTGPAATGYMLSSGGLSGLNSIAQLNRIQSANYGANIPRTDVNTYGQVAPLDRLIIQAPSVNLNLDWLVANTYNTNTLGFVTDGSSGVLSFILNKTADEKNYFIETVPQGEDAFNNTDIDANKSTIGIGNGFLTNFQARGSVGNFPTESITVEALNFVTYVGTSGLLSPAIVPSGGQRVTAPNQFILPTATSGSPGAVAAIRPGDITVTLSDPTFGPKISDWKINSYDLSMPINRQALVRLGNPFPFAREINFPVNITLTIEGELGQLVTGDLSTLYCQDYAQNITITLAKPQCGSTGPVAVQYQLLGAKMEEIPFTSSIGQNERVTMRFIAPLGSSSDIVHNLYISGSIV